MAITTPKLTELDIPVILELRRSGLTYKEIAARFTVHDITIRAVCLGLTWKHLGSSHSQNQSERTGIAKPPIEVNRSRGLGSPEFKNSGVVDKSFSREIRYYEIRHL